MTDRNGAELRADLAARAEKLARRRATPACGPEPDAASGDPHGAQTRATDVRSAPTRGGKRRARRPHAAGASRILVAGVSAATMLGVVGFLTVDTAPTARIATAAAPTVPVPANTASTTAPATSATTRTVPLSPPASTPAGAAPPPRPSPRRGSVAVPVRGGASPGRAITPVAAAAPRTFSAPRASAPAPRPQVTSAPAPAPVTKTKAS